MDSERVKNNSFSDPVPHLDGDVVRIGLKPQLPKTNTRS